MDIKVTAAIGAAGYPWNADSEDDIIKKAWAGMVAHRRTQETHPVANGASASAGAGTTSSDPAVSPPS